MARIFNYSFESTTLVISHPDVGAFSAYGSGIGKITISLSSDGISQQDVANDLSVIISKFPRRDGSITVNVAQGSDFAAWLRKYYNYCLASNPNRFALATITISNNQTGESFKCSGVYPQHVPEIGFDNKQTPQDWVLNCANIDIG